MGCSPDVTAAACPMLLVERSHTHALFMDTHAIEGGVKASDVAQAHPRRSPDQDRYGVRYLQYWVDEAAGKVFCLVDAPDAEAANRVHREAHGLGAGCHQPGHRGSMTMTPIVSRMAATVLAAVLLGTVAVTGAAASRSDLAWAKAATARYNSVNQAIRAGYGLLPAPSPLHECIMSLDGAGGMGLHYINPGLLDGSLDATRPEALVYAPDQHGRLGSSRSSTSCSRMPGRGRALRPCSAGPSSSCRREQVRHPAFYELHAWIWEPNPGGLFDDFNPHVSCD